MKDKLMRVLKDAHQILRHNIGYKLLSVFCAVLLWSYVIASDPTTMRDVVFADVEVAVNGLSVLSSNELALNMDLGKSLSPVRVRLEVPQAYYSRISKENIRVELDLSRIRQPGTHTIALSHSTPYGKITQVTPPTVDVTVDSLEQRYIPVNERFVGPESSDRSYVVSRINPSNISVSGPAEQVRRVARAVVELDRESLTQTGMVDKVEGFTLLDASDQEVDSNLLLKGTSSVSVSISVYPQKMLDILDDIELAVVGELKEGYEIMDVEIHPNTVSVAAEQALLDELDKLQIEPVDVDGKSATFTTVAKVQKLSDIRGLGVSEVNVTVHIAEIQKKTTFDKVRPTLYNPEERTVTWTRPSVSGTVSGPYWTIQEMKRGDIRATVNVEGLAPGTYELPIELEMLNHPELEFTYEPQVVKVVVE